MISLQYPAILMATIPAALLVLALLRKSNPADSPLRRGVSFSVRFLTLAALGTAMAGPHSVGSVPTAEAAVFALDVSDSVSEGALEKATAAIEFASKALSGRGALSSLILYAGNARVARPPSVEPIRFGPGLVEQVYFQKSNAAVRENSAEREKLIRARQEIDPLRTDAEAALLLAQAMYRPGFRNRTILVTDGIETSPDRRLPLGDDVEVLRLPPIPVRDVALRGIRAPLAVRAGKPFDLDLDVYSDQPDDISVALTLDGKPVAGVAEKFRVAAGPTSLRIRNLQSAGAFEQGTHRILAVISSPTEREPRNNSATATITVVGKSRLLLVEGNPEEGEGFAKLLTVQGIDYDRMTPDALAARVDELDRWASVALVGVAPAALPDSVVDSLESYLENGGGVFFAATSRIVEGLAVSPRLAKLLPVEMIPAPPAKPPDPRPDPPKPPPIKPPDPPKGRKTEPKKVLAPPIALLLILDRSGSMAGDGMTLTKEAAIATSETLSDKDYLGVLGFDDRARWVVEFTEARRDEYIKRNILGLFADGRTNLQPALTEAHRTFKDNKLAASAGVKHCIILSDGIFNPEQLEETTLAMAKDGITVSVVCVVSPDGFNDKLMRKIAEWGKGRYSFADSFKAVPKIFTNETRVIVKETVKAAEAKALADQPPIDPEPPTRPPDPPPDPPKPDVPPPPTPKPEARKVAFKDEHEVLRGIDREKPPPPLAGALDAKARTTSYVPLAFTDGTPALAVWRYGLGRSAAWVSDIGGPWSAEWTAWPGTTKLFAQVVRHLSNAVEDIDLASALRVERRGSRVDIRFGEGVEIHEVSPQKRLLTPTLEADGTRRVRLPLTGVGVPHQISIVGRRGEQTENLSAEFVLSHPLEIAAPPDRPEAFENVPNPPRPLEDLPRILPGATVPEPEKRPLAGICILIALLLLPLDVAIRRLR